MKTFGPYNASRFPRLFRRFSRDKRGVSAIEFAFIFPIMAALYLGGTALTEGIIIKRKVTLATRTLGDLTSQDTNIVDAEMNNIIVAASTVLQPYPLTTMTMTVTSLRIDPDTGVATVEWSDRSVNGGARQQGLAVGTNITVPPGVQIKDGKVYHFIMAQSTYTYTPPVGTAYISTLPLSETFYLLPRRVTCITRNSVACVT